jgi:hypothetical protein
MQHLLRETRARDNAPVPEPSPEPTRPSLRARLAAALARRPRLRRELIFLAWGLGVGFFVMPPLIYVAGVLTLGPYTSGGLARFLGDFYLGLFHGWPATWGVVAGPYALILLLRVVRFILRRYLARPESA